MTGRRAVVALSMLGALVLFAFAAQAASAAGTTAFTCVEGTGAAGFADEHCDTATTGEGVKFLHKEIKPNLQTAIVVSNEKTAEETKGAAVTAIRWLVAGITLEVQCTKASGTGGLENKAAQAAGTLQIEYTGCTVTKSGGAKCNVKEPIVQSSNFSTYEAAKEMGVELTPKEKGVFVSITIQEGEKCGAKGTYGISGNAQGTPGGSANGAGATLAFTEGMGSLAFAGNPATLVSTLTLQTKQIFGFPEDPIVFTTS